MSLGDGGKMVRKLHFPYDEVDTVLFAFRNLYNHFPDVFYSFSFGK